MSKLIKMTPEIRQEVIQDFINALNTKAFEGKFEYKKTLNTNAKTNLKFSNNAYLKMIALVKEFSTEIAWHGIAERTDDDGYVIKDIIVYPQEVTGATVQADEEKYQEWLIGLDDEVFNHLRMQGHSHVNMATSPSGVDDNLYEEFLTQLSDDDFYIFLIWNKKGDKWINIYDMAKNILFETKDITVDIDGLNDFVTEAKTMVQTRPVVTVTKSKTETKQTESKADLKPKYPQYYNGYYGYDDGYEYDYTGNYSRYYGMMK